MTREQFRKIRTDAGLRQWQLASALRVSTMAVQHWEAGRRKVSDQVEGHLEALGLI